MPITVTPTQPGGVFTPGGLVKVQSDFVGPLPSGTLFRYTLFPTPTSESFVWSASLATQSQTQAIAMFQTTGGATGVFGETVPVNASTALLKVELVQPTNVVIDSGTQAAPWSSTDGLGVQLQLKGTGSGQGGLTTEQALQLSQTHASTFIDQLLDNVTLIPLTAGPSPGPINSVLHDTVFGVIVRIANVPEDLVPNTPDGDYWFPSLAVVRVFRGSDLWKRIPIHTSSKLCGFIEENIVSAVSAITATQWLLNMSLQVTFRAGVTGEVFLMRFP